jgi:prefoldin subunit 5
MDTFNFSIVDCRIRELETKLESMTNKINELEKEMMTGFGI